MLHEIPDYIRKMKSATKISPKDLKIHALSIKKYAKY